MVDHLGNDALGRFGFVPNDEVQFSRLTGPTGVVVVLGVSLAERSLSPVLT